MILLLTTALLLAAGDAPLCEPSPSSGNETCLQEEHPAFISTGHALAKLFVKDYEGCLSSLEKASREIEGDNLSLNVVIALAQTVACDNLDRESECECSLEKLCCAIWLCQEIDAASDGHPTPVLSPETQAAVDLLNQIASLSKTSELRDILLALISDLTGRGTSALGFDGTAELKEQTLGSQSFWNGFEKIANQIRHAAHKFSVFIRDMTDVRTTFTSTKTR